MKITQVAVDVLRVPVERAYVAGGRTVDANWHVLARVATSDGVAHGLNAADFQLGRRLFPET